MNKRAKNILIIVLLLLVNIVGFYIANSYFTGSYCDNCETAKSVFSDWFGTKATLEQTAKWIDSFANLLRIFKGV